jgi:hypothetical protein
LLERVRTSATVLTTLAVFLAVTDNALADTHRISDGNDRSGPLDIRSASHVHSGALSAKSRRGRLNSIMVT